MGKEAAEEEADGGGHGGVYRGGEEGAAQGNQVAGDQVVTDRWIVC